MGLIPSKSFLMFSSGIRGHFLTDLSSWGFVWMLTTSFFQSLYGCNRSFNHRGCRKLKFRRCSFFLNNTCILTFPQFFSLPFLLTVHHQHNFYGSLTQIFCFIFLHPLILIVSSIWVKRKEASCSWLKRIFSHP